MRVIRILAEHAALASKPGRGKLVHADQRQWSHTYRLTGLKMRGPFCFSGELHQPEEVTGASSPLPIPLCSDWECCFLQWGLFQYAQHKALPLSRSSPTSRCFMLSLPCNQQQVGGGEIWKCSTNQPIQTFCLFYWNFFFFESWDCNTSLSAVRLNAYQHFNFTLSFTFSKTIFSHLKLLDYKLQL